MINMVLNFPFGEGEAQVYGTFTPFRQGRTNCSNEDAYPDEPADFYIGKFEVGGVDIFDEIDRMLVTDSLTKKQVWYIDHITPKLIELAEAEYNEEIQQRMIDVEDW